MPGSEATTRDFLQGFRQGLTELGLAEGKDIQLEIRYATGRVDQLDSLATDIVSNRLVSN
jgi:hypothetical protein